MRTIPLTGAWDQVPDEFNANGISTTPDGRALLVVQSFTGKLFKVNPRDGHASRVGLGGYTLTNGDGMLRQGRVLYVAQNRDNKVAVIRLTRDGSFGRARGHAGVARLRRTDDDRELPAQPLPAERTVHHPAHTDDGLLDHQGSPLGVELVDHRRVVVLDDVALDLHRRGELARLHGEVVVEELELLDRLPRG